MHYTPLSFCSDANQWFTLIAHEFNSIVDQVLPDLHKQQSLAK